MKKFRRVTVYKAPGKTNVRESAGRAGVYLIYKGTELRYIGHSTTDLYKTLVRHFQSWDDPRQVRVTYPQTPEYKVSIVHTTEKQAPRLEAYLIKTRKPPDNPDKLQALLKFDKATLNTAFTYNSTPTKDEYPF